MQLRLTRRWWNKVGVGHIITLFKWHSLGNAVLHIWSEKKSELTILRILILSMHLCTGLQSENSIILCTRIRVKQFWCEPMAIMLFPYDWFISGTITEFWALGKFSNYSLEHLIQVFSLEGQVTVLVSSFTWINTVSLDQYQLLTNMVGTGLWESVPDCDKVVR